MTVSIGGGPTYQDPTGSFYAVGKYLWDTPELSMPMYHILYGSAPGAQGSYSINMGLRSQEFTLRVMYVAVTADSLLSQWATDAAALVGPADVTLGPITLKRCFAEPGGTHCTPITKIVNSDGDIVYMMYCNIKMSSKGAQS